MKRLWSVVLIATLFVATACGSDSDDDTATAANENKTRTTAAATLDEANPFRIVGVLPLSGGLSTQGNILKAGAEVAIDEINDNGGVLGRKVVAEFVDDASDPTKATSLLQEKLSGGDKPDLVIPGAGSAEVLAMLPLLTRNQVFSIGISASAPANDPKTNPYHFNLVHASNDNMAAVRPFVEEQGVKTLGVFFSNDALGDTNLEAVRAAFEGSDVKLEVERFTPTDLDLTAPLQRLRAKNPELIFYSTYGASAGRVLNARAKLGWDVPIIGDAAVTASNVADLVPPEELDGVEILSVKEAAEVPADGRPDPERWGMLLDGIKSKLGTIDQTLSIGSYGYTAVTTARVAAEIAGSTEAAAMAKALESYDPDPKLDTFWINFEDPGFTPESHIVAARDRDYVLVPAGRLVDGLLPAAAS